MTLCWTSGVPRRIPKCSANAHCMRLMTALGEVEGGEGGVKGLSASERLTLLVLDRNGACLSITRPGFQQRVTNLMELPA
jgi:hypothetical protein